MLSAAMPVTGRPGHAEAFAVALRAVDDVLNSDAGTAAIACSLCIQFRSGSLRGWTGLYAVR